MDTKNNCREVGKDFPTVGVFQFVCNEDQLTSVMLLKQRSREYLRNDVLIFDSTQVMLSELFKL